MSQEELDDELGQRVAQLQSSHGMTEAVSYNIWGAAVTATRAFDKVTIKLEPALNRIFVSIQLRWWASFGKFKPLHKAWLHRAEKRCQEQCPPNWRLLVFYEKGDK